MSDINAEDKWNKIYSAAEANIVKPQPTDVLENHACLLPEKGIALDLAAGLGGNAIFLAERGLNSHAWDISLQATNRLQRYCDENSLSLFIETRDVEQQPPSANTFDVICVSYYLERSLTQHIISALKPNGLLFYQTFIQDSVSDAGPRNSKYRLQANELLIMFSSLHILVYQEYGRVGEHKMGLRDTAQLVAQKR